MSLAARTVAETLRLFNEVAIEQSKSILNLAENAVERTIQLSSEALKVTGCEKTEAKAKQTREKAEAEMQQALQTSAQLKDQDQANNPVATVLDGVARAYYSMLNEAVSNQAQVNTLGRAILASGAQTVLNVRNLIPTDPSPSTKES